MKQIMPSILLASAAILLLPLTVRGNTPPERSPSGSTAEDAAPVLSVQAAAPQEICRLLETASGTVQEIPLREYLIGAVAAEMPASYEPAALAAQAVAIRTYFERMHRIAQQTPDPALCGADLSDDARHYLAYCPDAQLRALWGEDYARNYAKIAEAAETGLSRMLCADGEPVAAAFHAISAGMTENAEAVWGTALPCLTSVSSDADRSAPHFEERIALPPDSVQKALGGIPLPEDPAEWFVPEEVTEAGTVLRMRCGGTVFSGQQIREMLGLRSACFTVTFGEGQLVFTTHGFGHGVGMSQYGANEMARAGSTFEEILLHYYPGAEICGIAAP